MQSPKRITVHELAEIAKVSVATVSRALNSATSHLVKPATRERIERLAEKHHFTPNLAAQNLRQTKFKTIGIVFPHHTGILQSEYYSDLLSGAADAMLESDYRLKMILLKAEKPKWDDYDFRGGEGVDGLILTYWTTVFSGPEIFKRLDIPCAVINNVDSKVKVRFVAGDHFAGGQLAAKHLMDKGHRKIAVFCGRYYSQDVKERYRGFRLYLRSKGVYLQENSIFRVDYNEEAAYEMTGELLKLRPRFSAIFCMNDIQAYGVLRRLQKEGVKCPKEISVVGYDDQRESQYTTPPLTTVRAPVYDMGRYAALDLMEHLEKKNPNFFEARMLPVELIKRKSVCMRRS